MMVVDLPQRHHLLHSAIQRRRLQSLSLSESHAAAAAAAAATVRAVARPSHSPRRDVVVRLQHPPLPWPARSHAAVAVASSHLIPGSPSLSRGVAARAGSSPFDSLTDAVGSSSGRLAGD